MREDGSLGRAERLAEVQRDEARRDRRAGEMDCCGATFTVPAWLHKEPGEPVEQRVVPAGWS